MTVASSLFLSLRYLFSPRSAREGGESSVRYLRGAVLGIAFSLVPLIVVLVVSDGMIAGITSRFIELGTYHAQAYAYGSGGTDELVRLGERISAQPGIRYAAPELQGIALAMSSSGRGGATVRAMPADRWDRDSGFRRYLRFSRGEWKLDGPTDILLGETLASNLAVGPGDTVRLMTVRASVDGTIVPRLWSFTVRGVFSSGYRELDSLWAFVSLDAGRRILPIASSNAFIGIKTDRPFGDLSETVAGIKAALPEHSAVYSWYELEESQYRSYQTTRQLLVFIMILIVFVAAINVSSSLIMLVLEKRRDIAALKSLGASPDGLTLSFLFCGLVTGVLGTAIGMASGIFVAANVNAVIAGIESAANWGYRFAALVLSPAVRLPAVSVRLLDPAYYLETIPVTLDPVELVVVASGTILLALLCSLLPALRAGRMKPLDILRKI
jgi:lipoprotein-releasing system permease protein